MKMLRGLMSLALAFVYVHYAAARAINGDLRSLIVEERAPLQDIVGSINPGMLSCI
jgi:hypothetical protein